MRRTPFPFAATAAALASAIMLLACGGDKPDALVASAKDYAAKNDHKAAIIQLKNALQQQPDAPQARYLLGVSLLQSGDPVAAEIELRKARELKYPDEEVLPQLAQAMLLQGKTKKLLEEFGNVRLAAAPAMAELQVVLAQAYDGEGNKNGAQQALQAALAAEPGNVAAQLMQVRQRLGTRDIDGATAQLESVLAKQPTSAEAWKLKGDLLFYVRRTLDEALVAYRKAVEVRPDFVPGHFGVVATLQAQNKLDEGDKALAELVKLAPRHPQTRYLEVQAAFLRKDFAKARELVLQLLKTAPNHPGGLELAGGLELERNSLVTAEEYLTKAVAAAPDRMLARRWLATAQLRSGQPEKALATLAPALESELPGTAVLLMLAGQAQLQTGNVAKAEAYFAKAAKLDPRDPSKQTSLALARMAGGKVDAGFEQLEGIAAEDKGVSADLALISMHLRRREIDKALKAIDGLEKKTPGQPLAANLRGRAMLLKNDMAAARKAFEAALQTDPKYVPAIASLAALDLADKKPEDARKRLEELLAREPKNMVALMGLADLKMRDGDPKKEVPGLLAKAIEANPNEVLPRVMLVEYHLRQRDAKQAVAVAQTGLAALPDRPELLEAAGRAHLAANDANQAVSTFTKLVALQPRQATPLLRLADAQIAAKNLSQAEQTLKKALELRPDLVETYQRLMAIYGEGKRYGEAQALARQVQKRYPQNPSGYAMEGDVLMAQQKFPEAAAVLQAGFKQAPGPDLLIRSHAALLRAGKTAEADQLAAGWLRDKPKDVAVPMYVADVALRRNDLPTAEKHYLAVLKATSAPAQQAVAYNNLAWVTAQLKKDGALGYAEKANTLVPDQPAFMDTLAMLLADQQEYKRAIELQTRAIGLRGGDDPAFRLNLARIYMKAGDKDAARKQLDELAKLGDKFRGQAEVEKLRAEL